MMYLNRISVIVFVYILSCRVDGTTKECSIFVEEIVNCYDNATNCDQYKHILNCSVSIVEKMSNSACADKIAQKIVKNYANIIYFTEGVFCGKTRLMDSTISSPAIKDISSYWLALTPGFLSAKGCGFFKMFLAASTNQLQPFTWKTRMDMPYFYIYQLYRTSSCSDTSLLLSNRAVEKLRNLYKDVADCAFVMKNSSHCKNLDTGGYYHCVDNATIKLREYETFRDIAQNLLDIARVTDELVCHHENISKAIESNDECVMAIHEINKFFSAHMNGYLTVEGCVAFKYKAYEWMIRLNNSTCPIVRDFWDAMKPRLPCTWLGLFENVQCRKGESSALTGCKSRYKSPKVEVTFDVEL